MSIEYFTDSIASFSEEEQERLQELIAPTVMEKIDYGIKSTAFVPQLAWRYIQAGGDEEILNQERLDRQEKLNKRFSHLSEEDRHSGAALTGSIGKVLLDPTYWAAGWLAAPTKIASMAGIPGRLARGGFEASKWGAVSGGVSALHQATEEEKIDPSAIAMNTLIGAGIGGALGTLRKSLILPPPSSSTVADTQVAGKVAAATTDPKSPVAKAVKIALTPPEKIIIRNNIILNKFAPEEGTSGFKILQDVPMNSTSMHEANLIIYRFKEAEKLRAAKAPNAPSASQLKKLKEESKAAEKFLKPEEILKRFKPQVDLTSDIAFKAISEASKRGIIDPTSISYLITRPIVGGAAGYGIGHTTKLITGEEDGMSPWFWMGIGMAGGALSNKLRTATLNPATKETAEKSLKALMKNNLMGQMAMLAAGTTSARNNVLGGWAATLNRAFSYQFGPGLKGPAVPGLEQRVMAIKDELFASLNKIGVKYGIAGVGDDAIAIRSAIWHHGVDDRFA